jgi:glutamate-5-semialdehyde dehydrogenase
MISQLSDLCDRARVAAHLLAPAARAEKDAALTVIASALDIEADSPDSSPVLAANARDVRAARDAGIEEGLVDRLVLDPTRLRAMAEAVRSIASFDDPIGSVVGMTRRPNGLVVGRVRIPLGVIVMIYEARPNVTVDSAALALKSGNVVLLRGGKEARESNAALGELVRRSIKAAGLPEDAVQIVPPGDREEIKHLVQMTGKVDLVIPRGGEALIRFVTEHARVPVIQHYQGVCHLYVDEGADLDMAERLIENAKLSRVGVCNALECLIVHRAIAPQLLPRLAHLVRDRGLEVRADAEAIGLIPGAIAAKPDDFGKEFLAKVLAVRVVADFDGALEHIRRYGSNHTEAICTRDLSRSQRFVREVDASCVVVNASTRFNDGGELGLGAEMGISTSKIHAYGPMGLEHLTTLKWIVQGDGHVR